MGSRQVSEGLISVGSTTPIKQDIAYFRDFSRSDSTRYSNPNSCTVPNSILSSKFSVNPHFGIAEKKGIALYIFEIDFRIRGY